MTSVAERLKNRPPSEPSYRCSRCISMGKNHTAFAPPKFGEGCCSCDHQCDEPGCCDGIEGWKKKMERWQRYIRRLMVEWAGGRGDRVLSFFKKYADQAWDAGLRDITPNQVMKRVEWELSVLKESLYPLGIEGYIPRDELVRRSGLIYLEMRPRRKKLFNKRSLKQARV